GCQGVQAVADLAAKILPPLHHLGDNRSSQGVFGSEVEIQRPFGAAAVGQHAVQRGGVIAITSEVFSCGGENRLPGGLRPGLRLDPVRAGARAAGSGSSSTGAGHDVSTLLAFGPLSRIETTLLGGGANTPAGMFRRGFAMIMSDAK